MSGGGTVIENLSGRKLALLCGVLLAFLVGCFLVGGLRAPAPSNSQAVLATICLDNDPTAVPASPADEPGQHAAPPWLQVWGVPGQHGGRGCRPHSIDQLIANSTKAGGHAGAVSGEHVVFAVQLPLRKDGRLLDFSRWQQNLIGVLQVEIHRASTASLDDDHEDSVSKSSSVPASAPAADAVITLDARLGYKNKHDPAGSGWRLLASSLEHRPLECQLDERHHEDDEDNEDGDVASAYVYDCQLIPLFELGSLHHDYYLLNIRLPSFVRDDSSSSSKSQNTRAVNTQIGMLRELHLVAIYANGGFTKVWLSLKMIFFPPLVVLTAWFWRRVQQLQRPAALLERLILAVAVALSVLNVPLELLSLTVDAPWLLLAADVRQGVFHATLLSFWLVFAGEHLMIAPQRANSATNTGLRRYWRHLAAVAVGCAALFAFDVCERGAQLTNPFYSVWGSQWGRRLALAFIVTAGVSGGVYFCFLGWMVWRVFGNIGAKRHALPSMSSLRRLHYEGIIYRFKFLMLATLVCAGMTVVGFVVGQLAEGQWKWDDSLELQYTAAVMCGVYGMWNVYTMLIVCMYAPSHKRGVLHSAATTTNDGIASASAAASAGVAISGSLDCQSEEIEFSRLTTGRVSASTDEVSDMISLTHLASKMATD